MNRKSLFGHQEMIWPVLATHTYMKRTVYTVCENCKKKDILQKTNNLLLSQNKLFKKSISVFDSYTI